MSLVISSYFAQGHWVLAKWSCLEFKTNPVVSEFSEEALIGRTEFLPGPCSFLTISKIIDAFEFETYSLIFKITL